MRDRLLAEHVPLEESRREMRFKHVPFDTLIDLARIVPVRDDDDGRWDTDAVVSVLENLRAQFDNEGALYVRSFEREPQRRFQTGVLSGPEVDLARMHQRPVLALVYHGTAANPEYWYPTLFLPETIPWQVFNANP
jgi:hypothetical protein